MTDADVPPPVLRTILKRSVERSYNRLSVDGDTSPTIRCCCWRMALRRAARSAERSQFEEAVAA